MSVSQVCFAWPLHSHKHRLWSKKRPDPSLGPNINYSYQSGKVGEGSIESVRLMYVYYYIYFIVNKDLLYNTGILVSSL